MKIQIKSIAGSLLFEGDFSSLAEALKSAVGQRANLQSANLQGAYLQRAYLQGADLQGANLQNAYLRGAYLQRANLQGAYLQNANLQGAYLQRAYLQGADLQGANLQRANLQRAYLQRAYLQGADLQRAYLQGADLQGANLQRAYLQRAYLQGADLQGAKNADAVISQTRILPEGSLIGWKKCRNDAIVKLLIPEKAKRSHAFGRKCRAEFVKVLEVVGSGSAISLHDNKTTYTKGKTVKCNEWNDDFTVECGGGIHFFITRLEAEQFTY